MIKNIHLSKFWRLALGLLFLGIGERFLFTGIVLPWAEDTMLSSVLVLLSLGLLALGLVLIIPIGIWFYRNYRSDRRLYKVMIAYLFSAVIFGLLIGGLGQFLYDYTSFSYSSVKTGIWAFSTIIQNILKIILCYSLVRIYQGLSISERKQHLFLPIILVVGVTLAVVGVTLWLPAIGGVVASVVDSVLLMMTLYYFLYLVD